MKLMPSEPSKAQDIVKRAMFLAYQASHPVGMGVSQQRTGVDEHELCDGLFFDSTVKKSSKIFIDYGYGRMMKVGFSFNPETGEIEVRDGNSRTEFNSWSSPRFPTFESLIVEAAKELNLSVRRCGDDAKQSVSQERDTDYGGVLGADNQVHSDADSGL